MCFITFVRISFIFIHVKIHLMHNPHNSCKYIRNPLQSEVCQPQMKVPVIWLLSRCLGSKMCDLLCNRDDRPAAQVGVGMFITSGSPAASFSPHSGLVGAFKRCRSQLLLSQPWWEFSTGELLLQLCACGGRPFLPQSAVGCGDCRRNFPACSLSLSSSIKV